MGKNMKKMLRCSCLLLVGVAAALTACTPSKEMPKVLKIGYTHYAPMAYFDEQAGVLTGFDVEFARKACAELGYQPEFVEIIWDSKVRDLQNGTIDCIWNGMTITQELQTEILVSDHYLENRQVAVLPAASVNDFTSVYAMGSVAMEKGGAAQALLTQGGISVSKMREGATQAAALALVGVDADCAVVDYVMAKHLVGKGVYDHLAFVEIGAPIEYFGVGFRKEDAELCNLLNGLIAAYEADGTLDGLRVKYLG